MTWQRLIKFEDASGRIRYGDPQLGEQSADDIEKAVDQGKVEATCYTGPDIFSLTPSNEVVQVHKILPILTDKDVPIVKCIGLNYTKHIQEGGRKAPPYPSVFIKPRASVAGYDEDIPIHKIAQEDQLDYEGELSVVIGKTGRDIPKQNALDHVAGYVASNDVSARKWQRDPAFAGGVPQWCFSKGFDKFAPLSPMLVSPKIVGNASGLRLQTFVNGETRQDSDTGDLLFGVEEIIAFISQGTTLEAGTVVMTGTPSGVAMGMAQPKWLKADDVVEVKIGSIGTVKNRMAFQ